MRRPTFLLLCLLSLAPAALPARAQPVRTLTPEAAVALGLEHGRTLRIAAAEAEEAAAGYRAARTLRLPTVTSRAAYQRLSGNLPDFAVDLPDLPGSPLPDAITVSEAILIRYDLQAGLQVPVFTGGRISGAVRAAEHRAEAARHGVDLAEADLVFDVEETFWQLYKAAAVRAVVDSALVQVEAHLADVRNFRENGLATERDVLAVQTRRAEVRLQQVEAANAVRLATLRLNHLTGLPLETVVRPEAEVAPAPLAEPAEAFVAAALGRRPELGAAAAQVEALAAGVDVARAGRYPQVALSGTYRYANPNPYFFPPEPEFNGTWDVGVVVSFDVWNWGRTGAEVAQARARETQAAERYARLREAVELDVRGRYLGVERALEAVAVAAQGLREAEASYRITRDQYREGLARSADLLDAEGAQREARTRYRHALADYALARAALTRATGR